MEISYLDNFNSPSSPWYKRRWFKFVLVAIAIVAIGAIVLFSRQIGEVLNLWGLKAAEVPKSLVLTADSNVTPEEFFFFEDGSGYNITPNDSLKIENSRLMLNH